VVLFLEAQGGATTLGRDSCRFSFVFVFGPNNRLEDELTFPWKGDECGRVEVRADLWHVTNFMYITLVFRP
jgi:hypothetical protein